MAANFSSWKRFECLDLYDRTVENTPELLCHLASQLVGSTGPGPTRSQAAKLLSGQTFCPLTGLRIAYQLGVTPATSIPWPRIDLLLFVRANTRTIWVSVGGEAVKWRTVRHSS